MKSEERHELQRNDLATSLTDLPGLWRRHGNKVLIVLTAVLLIFWAVRYKRQQAAVRAEQTRQALANAWAGVGQVSQLANLPISGEMLKMRQNTENEVNQAVALVTDDTDAPAGQVAWAWLARGQMYWDLAHAPAPEPKATTQPTTQSTTQAATAPASQPAEKSADEYLTLSSNAFNQVVNNFPKETTAVTIARYGLAAIAEEKRDFAEARKQYQAISATENFLTPTTSPSNPVAKSMAESRLEMLNKLEKPTLLLPATQPVAVPPSSDDLLKSLGNMGNMQLGPMTPPAAPSK